MSTLATEPDVRAWRSLAVVALANLLPLAFVLGGGLDLALLVTCYVVEGGLIFAFGACAHPGFPPVARLVLPSSLLIFGAGAVMSVDWDLDALVVLTAAVLFFVVGAVQAARLDRDSQAWTFAGFGWHLLVVLVGAMVAVPYMEHVTDLRAAGWEPFPLWGGPLAGMALGFNRLLVDSSLPPHVLGTTIFVLFKTLNEAIFSAGRILRSPPSHD